MTEINKKLNLAAIPPTNNDGDPYILPLDIYKEGYQAYNISNWFKGRVGDNGTPFAIRWYSHGRLLNIHGMRPFIEGQVGDYTIDDSDPDNVRIDMAEDASNIHIVGDVDDSKDGGVAIYRLINQAFPKSGIFYGKIGFMGTQDDGTLVNTGVDIVFKVLAGHMEMMSARKFYVTELEKALTEFKEKSAELQKDFQDKMDSNEQNFNARMTTELQNLQDHVNSYLSKYEGAVKYNIASLDHLSAVASSIDAELKAANVANKQEFDQLKTDIATKLADMQIEPTVVSNITELQNKYPNGAIGMFITADDNCLAYYQNKKWNKGASYSSSGLSENTKKQLAKDDALSTSLLNIHNGEIVYSFHALDNDPSGHWCADDNYNLVSKLPKGYSHFAINIKSQVGSEPKIVIAELQDDGNYIGKSAINLKIGTGEPITTEFDYVVANDNTFLFISGKNAFFYSLNSKDNYLVQCNGIAFDTETVPNVSSKDKISFAGVNLTLFAFRPKFTEAIYANADNFYSNVQTPGNSDHFWNVTKFRKGDVLTKAIAYGETNIKFEIRENVDGVFVLKKRVQSRDLGNGYVCADLNYSAKNDGIIFVSGTTYHVPAATTDELFEYDDTDAAIRLTPTANAHASVWRISIFKITFPTFLSDLVNETQSGAVNKAIDEVTHNQDIVLYDHMDDQLTNETVMSVNRDRYWGVYSFKQGDYLSKAIIKTTDAQASVEIREKEDGQYVLKSHVNSTAYQNGERICELDYTAANDGIIFVNADINYSISPEGILYEYVGTPQSVVPQVSTGSIIFQMTIYTSNSLINQTINAAVDKMRSLQEIQENQAPKFNLNLNCLPRLIEAQGKYTLFGRWYTKTIDGVEYHVTNNNGSEILFSVSNATYVEIDWKSMIDADNARWSYTIDDNDFNSISTTTQKIDIPDKDKHIIRIVMDAINQAIHKWDQGNGFAFSTITSDGTTAALKSANPIIMYFGDSITEGIRTLGMDEKGPGCSVLHAYSWLSAQFLNAMPYIIGYGGQGLKNPGSFNTADYSVDWMTQSIPENKINPNLIIINEGTNDTMIDDDHFSDLYKKFIHKLVMKYPGVKIGCMVPFNGRHGSPIRKIAEETKDCLLIDTSDWDITTTDGTHPNVEGSRKAALKLAQSIDKQLGQEWRSPLIYAAESLEIDA